MCKKWFMFYFHFEVNEFLQRQDYWIHQSTHPCDKVNCWVIIFSDVYCSNHMKGSLWFDETLKHCLFHNIKKNTFNNIILRFEFFWKLSYPKYQKNLIFSSVAQERKYNCWTRSYREQNRKGKPGSCDIHVYFV